MAQEEKPRKIEYPSDESSYKILHEIGKGVSAIVYKAVCLPVNSSTVAIKAIDLDQSRVDLENVIQETKTMTLLSHPNILQAHRSFMVDSRLWVVMPFMSAGSLQSIIASSFPYGLSEPCIAIVLRDILNALSYLHGQGHLHRDIKAGNILIDSDGTVKLADFGVSASIYETNSSLPFSSSLMLNEVAGTPFWMAPEVIHSHNGYGFKADIWSFGITALELAHGRPPLSHLPLSKSLILRITHRFRFFDIDKNRKDKKKFSKSFKNMVASCLITDPSKRPTAEKLLRHPFFKSCKNADFLVRNMLQGLPTVEERFKKTKQIPPPPPPPPLTSSVDEDNPEEGTPAVKHRRISGWNFNEEVLEFEPVFPTEKEESSSKTREEESISKRVRFAGEMIIHESSDKDDDNPSPTIPAEHTEVSRETEQSLITQRSNEESEMEETGSQINTDEPEIGGYDDVGLQNPPALQVGQGMVMGAQLIPNLEVIQRSLSIEQQVVSNLLAQIRGEVVEMNREEQLVLTIQQLIVDLEREKIRSSALEMQLESMRSNAAGVSHTNSGATASNGHGSSSE